MKNKQTPVITIKSNNGVTNIYPPKKQLQKDNYYLTLSKLLLCRSQLS